MPVQADESLSKTVLHEEARFLMGTLARIQVSGTNLDQAAKCTAAGFHALEFADSLFSTWRQDSEISFINTNAAQGPVKISAPMATVISTALKVAISSNCAFDPTVLPLVELWGFRGTTPAPHPSLSAIKICLDSVGSHLVVFQPDNQTVEFLHPKTQLDFGGIAKGHALDMAAAAMMEAGAIGGMIDLGGGLLIFGESQKHQVGVVNPLDSDNHLAIIPMSNGSVATSGQYERNRENEGKTWGHILDPRTGQPCHQTLSVTVITPSAILADALATACFVLGPDDGFNFLEKTPNCEGLIVFKSDDGSMQFRKTQGLPSNHNQ